jgi:hypothetical protein
VRQAITILREILRVYEQRLQSPSSRSPADAARSTMADTAAPLTPALSSSGITVFPSLSTPSSVSPLGTSAFRVTSQSPPVGAGSVATVSTAVTANASSSSHSAVPALSTAASGDAVGAATASAVEASTGASSVKGAGGVKRGAKPPRSQLPSGTSGGKVKAKAKASTGHGGAGKVTPRAARADRGATPPLQRSGTAPRSRSSSDVAAGGGVTAAATSHRAGGGDGPRAGGDDRGDSEAAMLAPQPTAGGSTSRRTPRKSEAAAVVAGDDAAVTSRSRKAGGKGSKARDKMGERLVTTIEDAPIRCACVFKNEVRGLLPRRVLHCTVLHCRVLSCPLVSTLWVIFVCSNDAICVGVCAWTRVCRACRCGRHHEQAPSRFVT